jgi:hypothetical protein
MNAPAFARKSTCALLRSTYGYATSTTPSTASQARFTATRDTPR